MKAFNLSVGLVSYLPGLYPGTVEIVRSLKRKGEIITERGLALLKRGVL